MHYKKAFATFLLTFTIASCKKNYEIDTIKEKKLEVVMMSSEKNDTEINKLIETLQYQKESFRPFEDFRHEKIHNDDTLCIDVTTWICPSCCQDSSTKYKEQYKQDLKNNIVDNLKKIYEIWRENPSSFTSFLKKFFLKKESQKTMYLSWACLRCDLLRVALDEHINQLLKFNPNDQEYDMEKNINESIEGKYNDSKIIQQHSNLGFEKLKEESVSDSKCSIFEESFSKPQEDQIQSTKKQQKNHFGLEKNQKNLKHSIDIYLNNDQNKELSGNDLQEIQNSLKRHQEKLNEVQEKFKNLKTGTLKDLVELQIKREYRQVRIYSHIKKILP